MRIGRGGVSYPALAGAFVALAVMALEGCGKTPEAPPVTVVIATSMGTIEAELDPTHAPKTVDNFLAYVDAGFYDGTLFHRVVPRFVIQGGGYDSRLQPKSTRPPVENESSKDMPNVRGALAMARTEDPNSATSQFFINLVTNPHLDRARYTVFGRVTAGMAVVDSIGAVETTAAGSTFESIPAANVVIDSIRVKRP